MPAKSAKQRRLFAIALSIKRGQTPKSYSPAAARMAKTMSVSQLRDFAKKRKKRRSR
ncbi:MAG: DUF3008 family protein [Fervidobacterium sp.]